MRYFLLGLVIYCLVNGRMKTDEIAMITVCIALITGFIIGQIDFALFSIVLSMLILCLG